MQQYQDAPLYKPFQPHQKWRPGQPLTQIVRITDTHNPHVQPVQTRASTITSIERPQLAPQQSQQLGLATTSMYF